MGHLRLRETVPHKFINAEGCDMAWSSLTLTLSPEERGKHSAASFENVRQDWLDGHRTIRTRAKAIPSPWEGRGEGERKTFIHCLRQRWAECCNRVAVGARLCPAPRVGFSRSTFANPSRKIFLTASAHPPAATGPADTVARRPKAPSGEIFVATHVGRGLPPSSPQSGGWRERFEGFCRHFIVLAVFRGLTAHSPRKSIHFCEILKNFSRRFTNFYKMLTTFCRNAYDFYRISTHFCEKVEELQWKVYELLQNA